MVKVSTSSFFLPSLSSFSLSPPSLSSFLFAVTSHSALSFLDLSSFLTSKVPRHHPQANLQQTKNNKKIKGKKRLEEGERGRGGERGGCEGRMRGKDEGRGEERGEDERGG